MSSTSAIGSSSVMTVVSVLLLATAGGATPATAQRVAPVVFGIPAAPGPDSVEFRPVVSAERGLRPTAPATHTLRSIGLLGGAGVAAFAIIWVMPEEVSKWDRTAGPDGFRPGWSSFSRAYTAPPVWDEDGWVVNYVAHPVVGMHTYLLERNHGASPLRAFLFSTAASVGWEYLIESWAEQPSAQDLLVTSTVGSLLGELNYQATQRLRRGGLSSRDKVLLTVINPVHVLQHGYR
jgi:hypothetical protein